MLVVVADVSSVLTRLAGGKETLGLVVVASGAEDISGKRAKIKKKYIYIYRPGEDGRAKSWGRWVGDCWLQPRVLMRGRRVTRVEARLVGKSFRVKCFFLFALVGRGLAGRDTRAGG